MEKVNQVLTEEIEMAVVEIIENKNLITAVQWWIDKLMERKTEKEIVSILLTEGRIYNSILGEVQSNLAQLRQSMDAAAEQGYEALKREKVQA